MPNIIDIAATAHLVNSTIPLNDRSTRSVEIRAWESDLVDVSIHMRPEATAEDVAAIARAIGTDALRPLGTTDSATMEGLVASVNEVTVYFPVALIDEVSTTTNILIEE